MANPKKLLKQLKLLMPIAITLEDPISKAPITIGYDNLHALLIVDVDALGLESQVNASLYAEMARFQRAAEYAAARADGKYRAWKAQMQDELRAQYTKEGKAKPPTAKALEDYYRNHPDYEDQSSAGERFKAIAGLFEDLKWAFKMKADMISDQSKIIGGYESVTRREESAAERERLADYHSIAEEVANISRQAGSSQAALDLLSGKTSETEAKRQSRELP